MICRLCGNPNVVWNKELTQTKCPGCGEINCQVVEPEMVECPKCAGWGDLESACANCDGTGLDEDVDAECMTCEGTGIETDECPDCDGTGEVDA